MNKRSYDRFFAWHFASVDKVDGYIYINTTRGVTPMRSGKRSFNDLVGFPLRTYPGEGNISYPVVWEDFTLDYGILTEISHDDIPPAVKTRYTKWERLQ